MHSWLKRRGQLGRGGLVRKQRIWWMSAGIVGLKIVRGNYAPDGNSIKKVSQSNSRNKEMDFGNARKGEEMGVREGQVGR
jgi:hypothetical protein